MMKTEMKPVMTSVEYADAKAAALVEAVGCRAAEYVDAKAAALVEAVGCRATTQSKTQRRRKKRKIAAVQYQQTAATCHYGWLACWHGWTTTYNALAHSAQACMQPEEQHQQQEQVQALLSHLTNQVYEPSQKAADKKQQETAEIKQLSDGNLDKPENVTDDDHAKFYENNSNDWKEQLPDGNLEMYTCAEQMITPTAETWKVPEGDDLASSEHINEPIHAQETPNPEELKIVRDTSQNGNELSESDDDSDSLDPAMMAQLQATMKQTMRDQRSEPDDDDQLSESDDDDELSALVPGHEVRLQGLKAKPELNGQEGTLLKFDEAKGRWQTKLRSGKVLEVKPENLKFESEPPWMKLERDRALFKLSDHNGDGRLNEGELRAFARRLGFSGSDEAWAKGYRQLCAQNGIPPEEGFDFEEYIRLLVRP